MSNWIQLAEGCLGKNGLWKKHGRGARMVRWPERALGSTAMLSHMEKGVIFRQGIGKGAKGFKRLPGEAGALMLQPCPIFTFAHLHVSFSHTLQLPIVFCQLFKISYFV